MHRNLPAPLYKALKTRFRQLVDEFGGVDAAASRTRVGPTALYNYGNLNTPDGFPPVDVLMDLENDCGNPVVTRELARACGYSLVKKGGDYPSAGALAAAIAQFAKESSDVFAHAARVLADGQITPAEARELSAQVDDGISALLGLSDLLRGASDGKDAFSKNMDDKP